MWGWSNESPEKAEEHAREIAKETRTKNDEQDIPLREDIIEEFSEHLYTRNESGAICLSTSTVGMTEINFYNEAPVRYKRYALITLITVSLIFLLLSPLLPVEWAFFGMLFIIASYPAVQALIWKLVLRQDGGQEGYFLKKLDEFLHQNPDWIVDTYRTPRGLNYIIMHDIFSPKDPEILGWLKQTQTRPADIRFAQKYHLFRLKISPEPMDLGIEPLAQMHWPDLNAAEKQETSEWINSYNALSAQTANLFFLKRMGPYSGTEILHPNALAIKHAYEVRAIKP